ncbi:MAG: ankyrin repeat domain-containing protein, partial [Verrucomicrobiota bacterium]|nr:ankyrin repeat domain-containing protein [Verrucomicrobiota bacterium]
NSNKQLRSSCHLKHLLITTISALLLVGCGPPVPDISIYDAVEDGNIEVVKQHLAAGTNVNSKDKDGWTPLHEAASEGRNKIIELLVAKGADVNAKDDDGETPVDAAANPETAGLLRKHGGKTGAE